MGENGLLRILTVDDNPIIRIGLRAGLEGQDHVASVVATGDPDEAVALVEGGEIDIVLLDVLMPAVNGLDLLPRLAGVPVMMLSHVDQAETVSAAMAAGAAGYLVHGALGPAAMAETIWRCWTGNKVVPEAHGDPHPVTAPISHGRLSPREVDVMDLVAGGLSNGEVARQLFLSEKTVKNHLNRIFPKLGVTTRSRAIVLWIQGRHDPAEARTGHTRVAVLTPRSEDPRRP